MKLYFLIFLLFTECTSYAGLKYSVGTDLFQMQYKEQRYKFDEYDAFKNPHKNITRLAWGLSYQPFQDKHLYLGMRTNRGVNYATQTTAFDTIANKDVDVSTKLTADSFYIATALHKNAIPYIIATNIETKTQIKYQSGSIVNSHKNTMLYGFGLAIPFKKGHSVALTYFFGEKVYNTKRTFGLSYNYYFNHM